MRGMRRLAGSMGAALTLAFGGGQCSALTAGGKTVAARATTGDIQASLTVVGGKADAAQFDVRITGVPARITGDSDMAGTVKTADIYRMSVKGPGIFDAIFTLDAAEVTGPDGALALPPI